MSTTSHPDPRLITQGGVPTAETQSQAAPEAPPVAAAAAEPAPVGNPLLIGLPAFLAGSFALGLVLTGYVPATSVGASIPIIMTATAIGLIIAAIWAANLAQSAVASVLGIFAGFWTSYAALVLGLTHNWFGITTADAAGAQKLFLLTWLAIIGLLTVGSLRLPMAFTVLFVLVEVALLFVFIGTVNTSTTETKTGGWFVFGFALVGAYLFLDVMSAATGGRNLPLGRPILKDKNA
jgi:succinate-acetate transporter protein